MTQIETLRDHNSATTVVDIPFVDPNNTKKTSSSSNLSNKNLIAPTKLCTPKQIDQIVKDAKQAFQTNRTKDIKFRKKQLRNLIKLVDENEDLICQALEADLNKPPFETQLCEITLLRNELEEFLFEIDNFSKPNHKRKSFLTLFDDVYVHNEPLGTVLVMGAWNYPFLLALSPFAGALAAGNAVVLKTSEHATHTGTLIAQLIEKYVDNEAYKVINCDLDTSKYLLAEHKFDYIFYTGGENGGKAVHEQAAKSLTPITLELGGKSPVYIDDNVIDNDIVWNRLFWGKFINAGQTCIAPDYVLCSEKAQQIAKKKFGDILKQFYDNDTLSGKNYTRIVNENHFERLKKIIKGSGIVVGGKLDQEKLLIEPAIVLDANLNDLSMQCEIFGPILPFITCPSAQKAIEMINSRPKPLALYIFSNSRKIQNQFMTKTSSGGVCINDTVLHISAVSLPFGGVGNSGFGKCHGTYSLQTFSNARSVLHRGFSPLLEQIGKMRYPPYTNFNLTVLQQLSKNRRLWTPGSVLSSCIGFVAGAASILAYQVVQESGYLS